MSAREISSVALAAYALVVLVVARQVTWRWVLEGNEGFDDDTLADRALTALAAIASASLWPVLLLIWGLTLLMPKTAEADQDTEETR
jgi:hypothetical protein